MDKRVIGILIGMIILIGICCLIITTSSNQMSVDGVTFDIPDSYSVVEDNNKFNLTNGKNSIFIKKTTTNDINKTIEDYIKSKEMMNNTFKVINLNIDDIDIYKVSVDNTTISHYWFEKNNKVYEVYTWSANQNTDLIVSDLIKSAFSFI